MLFSLKNALGHFMNSCRSSTDASGFEGIAAAVNSHLDPLADNANSAESCMSWIEVFRRGFTSRHRRVPFRVRRSVEAEINPWDWWYSDSRGQALPARSLSRKTGPEWRAKADQEPATLLKDCDL
jgi:hypothetical protein